jgi:DNA-binding CsgD family transcriptional regulator
VTSTLARVAAELHESARKLFADVVTANRTAVEVTPRPDPLPFFAALASESSSVMTYRRKRRGLEPLRRYSDGYIIIAEAPERTRAGRSGRATAQGRRPAIDEATRARAIALLEAGQSLREVARALGISHETVRRLRRQRVAV